MCPQTSEARGPTCYVRVTGTRAEGFIEFEFAIGDPELAVELVMHPAAFHEFCARHRVVEIDEATGARIDHERLKWRYGAPGIAH